jgi:hypothetical protein
METGAWRESLYSIKAKDSLSASVDIATRRRYGRGKWEVSSATRIVMHSSETHFHVEAFLEAFEGDRPVHKNRWTLAIPRDHV